MPVRFRRAIPCALLVACGVHAQSPVPLPPINLGLASFMDAEGGPGMLVQSQNTAYEATRTLDAAGDRLPGPFRQEAQTSLLHVAYTTRCKLAGGYVGFEALVPFTNLDVDAPGLDASRFGVGDLILGAFLQWPALDVGGDRFAARADFVLIAPTGQYSAYRPLNAGFNVWELSPYVTATWHLSEKWEVSGRLSYNWSAVNEAPAAVLEARSTQAGQQASLNLGTSYAVAPGWRAGVAGYRLQQLTDSKIEGRSLPGLKQRLWGAGPGLLWSDGHWSVVANLYKEFGARNRPEGAEAVLRLVAVF